MSILECCATWPCTSVITIRNRLHLRFILATNERWLERNFVLSFEWEMQKNQIVTFRILNPHRIICGLLEGLSDWQLWREVGGVYRKYYRSSSPSELDVIIVEEEIVAAEANIDEDCTTGNTSHGPSLARKTEHRGRRDSGYLQRQRTSRW